MSTEAVAIAEGPHIACLTVLTIVVRYLFSAAVLVAAHYDLEPMGPLALKPGSQEDGYGMYAFGLGIEDIEVWDSVVKSFGRSRIRG